MTETQTQARTFDRETVTQVLNEVVAEFGEHYVYPGAKDGICTYGEPSAEDPDEYQPSCIVGQIIARIDPEAFQALVKMERLETTMTSSYLFQNPNGVLYGAAEDSVSYALRGAQTVQDNGETWGYARDVFLARLDMD